jgi:large subunit ribosomal protein L24
MVSEMKIKSSQPRKKRKFLYTAPLHIRRKLLAAHLSKELRSKYKTRSFPLRKGDEVEIMRGKFDKRKGKISSVNYKNYRIYVEGVTRKKTAGTEVQVAIHPSKVRVLNLDLSDKKRLKSMERKMKKVK